MSEVRGRVTVSTQQIAEIAGVGRSAVGNWRKRHSNFPVPDSRGGFDLRQIERWLFENGKIDRPVPAGLRAWSLADGLRNFLDPDEITQMLVAVLIYLEVCDATPRCQEAPTATAGVGPSDSWDQLRQLPSAELGARLRSAAARIESENPCLDDLLIPGFAYASTANAELLRSLIDSLEAATDETTSRSDLFEEVFSRAHGIDRFRGEHSTPSDVARLMVQLAGDRGGTVCDLACGEGGLLMSAALHRDGDVSQDARLIGFEISDTALRIARARFLLSGLRAELRLADAFRVPPDELPRADLVLVDPPLAQKHWADADVYMDDRWTFGAPSPRSADLAWVQLATQCLAENGRGVVLTTTGAAAGSGSDARVRQAMLEAGVVQAVVGLPSRLRANTSIPLALWVLRPPSPNVTSVLLVDASTLGTTGRSQHSFDQSDIDRVAAALQAHERAQPVDSEIAWPVDVTEVIENGAIFDPKRYRPAVEVNVGELRERAEEIRTCLPTSADAAADAVSRSRDWVPQGGGLWQAEPNRVLESVAEILRGTASPRPRDSENGVPLFGTAEVSAGDPLQARLVDPDDLGVHPVHLQAGDVVVALAGVAGQSKLVTAYHAGAVLGRECAVVRPTSPELTSVWTYIWTQSTPFREQVLRHTAGTTLPRLGFGALQSFKIPVPPMEDQRKAEELLRELDDAIVRVDEVHSQLNELRELRLDLFVADVRGGS
ncbi:N-6 DNA methylase [Candidatus Poriferisodalis sp.]|uniref:N-6 DNA methylase n=1 Tax=Candidatus Poriferisodalis sp. TaxID=3101277 RepID=UPI003B515B78